MNEVTQLLRKIDEGDSDAADDLLPLVYNQLRDLAKSKLRHERPDHTLQATALVHEAYLRLVESSESSDSDAWNSRAYFFAAAAEAMRRILVESVRHKKALKRGGDHNRVAFESIELPKKIRDDRLLALDDALTRLEEVDPTKANLVKLRVFSGMTKAEAATALGISARTADRYWNFARAWLINEIGGE